MSSSLEVVLFGLGGEREASRLSAVRDCLSDLDIPTDFADPAHLGRALVDDPAGICASAIDVSKILDSRQIAHGSVLMVCGVDAALTESGVELLRSAGVRSVLFDDSGRLELRRAIHLASRYDLVATQSYELHRQLRGRGFKNVEFVPRFVSPRFPALLQAQPVVHSVVHVRESEQVEESICPAMVWDLPSGPTRIYSYPDLEGLSLHELAAKLKSSVALMSPSGSRLSPRLHELSPYVAVSTDWLFFARHPVWERMHPYGLLATSVYQVGELSSKARTLAQSARLRETQIRRRKSGANLVASGVELLGALLSKLQTTNEVAGSTGALKTNGVVSITLQSSSESFAPSAHEVALNIVPLVGEHSDWWVRVRVRGKAIQGFASQSALRLLVVHQSLAEEIAVELVYLGPDATAAATEGIRASGTVHPTRARGSRLARQRGVLQFVGPEAVAQDR